MNLEYNTEIKLQTGLLSQTECESIFLNWKTMLVT